MYYIINFYYVIEQRLVLFGTDLCFIYLKNPTSILYSFREYDKIEEREMEVCRMIHVDETALVIVDVQGKLAKIMHQSKEMLTNLERMIQGANVLDIPIIWLEQYPKGLGPTSDEVKQHLTNLSPIAKMTFSACNNDEFKEALEQLNCQSILLTGIESHICVYQTARDLLKEDYYVETVVDCISSRTVGNKEIGLEKMKQLGAHATSVEMALFDLMGSAEHPNFKEISKIIK